MFPNECAKYAACVTRIGRSKVKKSSSSSTRSSTRVNRSSCRASPILARRKAVSKTFVRIFIKKKTRLSGTLARGEHFFADGVSARRLVAGALRHQEAAPGAAVRGRGAAAAPARAPRDVLRQLPARHRPVAVRAHRRQLGHQLLRHQTPDRLLWGETTGRV